MSDRARIYLVMAVIGLVTPLTYLGFFIADEGLDLAQYLDDAYATTASAMLVADLIIAATVFVIWLWKAAPEAGMSPWPFVAATLLIGFCFAFPLFLYLRERKREASPAAAVPA
jgi:Terpene cyclase DEP1